MSASLESAGPKLYKVLVSSNAEYRNHHGSMVWSLPIAGEPGGWHEIHSESKTFQHHLRVCLADEVVDWIYGIFHDHVLIDGTFEGVFDRIGIYECEVDGNPADYLVVRPSKDTGHRVYRERLLRRVVDHADLAKLGIYLSGKHYVFNRPVIAHGDAQVHVSGVSTLCASGNSTVFVVSDSIANATGRSKVYANGKSRILAYDDVTVDTDGSVVVEAWDRVAVVARGESVVHAFGSSTADAYDQATVRAFDRSSVTGRDSVTVIRYDSKVRVSTLGYAVLVDRCKGEDSAATVHTETHETHETKS